MFVFDLPEVGEGVVEGELVKWLVSKGDSVQEDQPICELMTDKATIEISSPKTGTVQQLHCDVGDIIEVHKPLITLDVDGSAPSPHQPKVEKPKEAPPAAPKAVSTEASPSPAPRTIVPPPAPVTSSSDKVLASPAVRAYAHQQGIELSSLQGSGRGGRITRDDINQHQHTPSPIAPPAIQSPTPKAGQDEVLRIIGLRRKIAEKMLESVQRAPHFTYVDEVDATNLVNMRKGLKGYASDKGVKLTYLPFIMKALALAFKQFPTVNAVMNEEEFSLVVRGEVNIGIATDTPQGLFVPVVKNVEQKSILELAAEVADLTHRTRENKVKLHELQGGTFTITSVGNIGGRFATPIINHPEVAILGVNQIHDRPMVIEGEIVARKMMYLSPSFDHRVIDGAVAARFVSALKAILETPETLLLELR
ncbi:MAG: dihydrolipoamide acetyltransferase family protein [Myxococcota bacterium]|nr:dihydrolipoamide acetyltransferase family protein [Myxococcota bacterium]